MSIKSLAERYNQFQHSFGQDELHDCEAVITALFAANFKKIANGKELVDGRIQLLSQLRGVKEFAGSWSIQSLEIIPSFDDANCTIRYFLKSQKAGIFEVIAILSVQQGQIDRIDEIYYQHGEW